MSTLVVLVKAVVVVVSLILAAAAILVPDEILRWWRFRRLDRELHRSTLIVAAPVIPGSAFRRGLHTSEARRRVDSARVWGRRGRLQRHRPLAEGPSLSIVRSEGASPSDAAVESGGPPFLWGIPGGGQ